MNIAGMIAKYFATSLAIEKVVSAPLVISSRVPISTISISLVKFLPRAADLWVQASLQQRQRLQQLFFSEGISFDGKECVRTAVTAPAFNWLQPTEPSTTRMVDLSWRDSNQIVQWLRRIDGLRADGIGASALNQITR